MAEYQDIVKIQKVDPDGTKLMETHSPSIRKKCPAQRKINQKTFKHKNQKKMDTKRKLEDDKEGS